MRLATIKRQKCKNYHFEHHNILFSSYRESFVWLFSTVGFQMSPQIVSFNRGIVKSVAFLHCVFSNVSSNCLHQRMYSHIDRICLTFLRCAFSNVSSNCLPERMHSHIGCICLAFLHCAFSNVFFFKSPA